jgi:hypothetical protein
MVSMYGWLVGQLSGCTEYLFTVQSRVGVTYTYSLQLLETSSYALHDIQVREGHVYK